MEGEVRGARRAPRLVIGLAALLILAVVAVLQGPAATAHEGHGHGPGHGPQPEVLTVSGPLTARAQLLSGCGVFRQVIDGEGGWSGLDASTLHVDFCLGSPPDDVHYPVLSGTFTITSADGTLTGDVSGDVQAGGMPPPEDGFPFRLELTVTAGTDRLASATGTLVLNGAFSYGAVSARGTISGTVTIPPGPPTSVDDCRRGGWRRHVDDHGRPFRSKRHCIAYVLHHT